MKTLTKLVVLRLRIHMLSNTALVVTDHVSRDLQQLCKHRSNNLKVEFMIERGSIVFPREACGADWPLVRCFAHAEELECRIDSTAPGQLDGLKGALSQHLDRFAFREAPLPFEWQDQ